MRCGLPSIRHGSRSLAATPNNALDRTAGSRSLAAAGQRERSAAQ